MPTSRKVNPANWHRARRVQAIAALSLMGIAQPAALPSYVDKLAARDGASQRARTNGSGHDTLELTG